jgi:hypothetical protein
LKHADGCSREINKDIAVEVAHSLGDGLWKNPNVD